jgi:hypothetical protein
LNRSAPARNIIPVVVSLHHDSIYEPLLVLRCRAAAFAEVVGRYHRRGHYYRRKMLGGSADRTILSTTQSSARQLHLNAWLLNTRRSSIPRQSKAMHQRFARACVTTATCSSGAWRRARR